MWCLKEVVVTRKPKAKTKIVYRDRAPAHRHANWISDLTVGQIKQWLFVMVPLITGVWIFAGPYVDAKAEELLRDKLTTMGMDPANIQTLNRNIADLQQGRGEIKNQLEKVEATAKELTEDVEGLNGKLDSVLELLRTQVQDMKANAK